MKVDLQYGVNGLSLEFPWKNVTVLQPQFVEGLPDEQQSFLEAVSKPIGTKPLRELIKPSDKVAVVIPDITRPLPSDKLLKWLFSHLNHIPKDNFTIINGTGSHRANTDDELVQMVGREVFSNYKIVNHNSHDPKTMKKAGKSSLGHEVFMNSEYVEADKRIIMGFIEPHFMAGFSGGYKAVFPGIADIDSIMHYHGAMVVAHPKSTWGILDGNPTQELIRSSGSVLPVDFCINVTLNRNKQITRYFCGETIQAHDQGCAYIKSHAMVACDHEFPIVVTTNGGYPLDQNLYQAVKGMCAGRQVISKDGLLISASRCNDGFPTHGNFKKLLFDHESPEKLLKTIKTPGFSMYDQWEAQLLAQVQLHCRVALYSEIPVDEVKRAHIEPISDIAQRIQQEISRIGSDARIAVLPEGPMTIPYLS